MCNEPDRGFVPVQVEQSTRSTNKSLQRLVTVNKMSGEDIYKALCSQTIDLVRGMHWHMHRQCERA